MSRSILRPEKLKKLPENVQRVIGDLDNTQLSYLQAAFSNVVFFDLLGLPTELRLMIYRFAMETETNIVHVKQWVVRPAEYDKNHMKTTPSIALLAVNRQVNSEAMMVFKELKTCNVAGDFLTNMRAHHRLALKLFTRFSVQVAVSHQAIDKSSSSELNKLFYKVVSAMIKGRKKVEKQARFIIDFRFVTYSFFTPISQSYAYKDLWSKAALQDKVASWRAELSQKLPNATMTSNADLEYYGVEYQMKGEVLFFVDKERQLLGKVQYKDPTSDLEVEFLPFEDAEIHSEELIGWP